MKVTPAAVVLALALSPLSARAAEIPSGFGGLAWGDAPSSDLVLTGRAPFEKPRRTRYYVRKKDSIELAGVKMRSAEYVFRDDRLAAVFCEVGGHGTERVDAAAFDALWGDHDSGADGEVWRRAKTIAVLLRPEKTGARGPLLALFAAPATDAEIAGIVKAYALRGAGESLAYRGGRPERDPTRVDNGASEQFRLEMERDRINAKSGK
jgi:hypothetical protein